MFNVYSLLIFLCVSCTQRRVEGRLIGKPVLEKDVESEAAKSARERAQQKWEDDHSGCAPGGYVRIYPTPERLGNGKRRERERE